MPYESWFWLVTSKEGVSLWIVPQKIYRLKSNFWVRVKPCGKSTRASAVMLWLGKPHSEQDKVGELQVTCS
ncbi:MAG: hypothetical protein US49_C0006G0139 [candidate division TM6 bacterium GW2011_GWF2_37_49]|nr:MAG: hypothetical protein US49_C0006G0139 [candidate division TM6 bacterium GW2011_GWF2_37_49]